MQLSHSLPADNGYVSPAFGMQNNPLDPINRLDRFCRGEEVEIWFFSTQHKIIEIKKAAIEKACELDDGTLWAIRRGKADDPPPESWVQVN